ncbi:MAG: hypothetical protein GX273_04465 [Bacteroidales bacterium]|nr:hypothetical protein [Bacteroidales bacterium]
MGLDMYLYRQERIDDYDLMTLLEAKNYFFDCENNLGTIESKQKSTTELIQDFANDWGLDEHELKINTEIIEQLRPYVHYVTTNYGYKRLVLSTSANNDDPEIMYWRKANEIHNWFVENVQNGVDDCGYYEVSIDQLYDLMDLVSEEYNFQEILDTYNVLKELAENFDSEKYYYYYHSSW